MAAPARLGDVYRILVTVVAGCYAVTIFIWLVLRAAYGDSTWWLALANTFTPIVLIGLIPLGLFVRSISSRLAVVAWSGSAAIFVVWFAPLFFPKPPPSASGADFKVMTLNLYEESIRVEPMLERIRAENPDVVALQELNPMNAEALRSELGESYPYQALLESAEEDAGLGVISRFPLQDHSWFLVGNTPRDAQWVTLNVRMHGIELLNVHLAKNWITVYLDKSRDYFESQNSVREEQAREISAFARTHSPLVVAGDLNTSDTTRTYEILRAELDDSFRDKGWGLGATFSSVWFPYGRIPVPPRILRLDYILHSHELYTVESYVGKADTQSDHLPVIATLRPNK